MKKRGEMSDKERMSILVKSIASKCKSLSELAQKLKAHNIDCYTRKNNLISGIWYGKRKLRLTTLGVGREHLKTLTREEKRLLELERIKQAKRNREKGRKR